MDAQTAACGPPVEYWWPADSKNNTLVHSKNIEFYSRIKPKKNITYTSGGRSAISSWFALVAPSLNKSVQPWLTSINISYFYPDLINTFTVLQLFDLENEYNAETMANKKRDDLECNVRNVF